MSSIYDLLNLRAGRTALSPVVKCSLAFFLTAYALVPIPLCAEALDARAEQPGSARSRKKLALGAAGLNLQPPAKMRPPYPLTGGANKIYGDAQQRQLKRAYPANSYERGMYFRQLGELDKALIEFIRAAQENPRNMKAFFAQAQIFKQQGKSKLAKSALEQALAVKPDFSEGRSFLVQLHVESGNLIGAASEVGKLWNLNNESKKSKADGYQKNGLGAASSAAIQIAAGGKDSSAAGAGDSVSQWLSTASNTASIEPAKENSVNGFAGPETTGVSGGGGQAEASGTNKTLLRPPSLQEILSQIGASGTADAAKSNSQAQAIGSQNSNSQEGQSLQRSAGESGTRQHSGDSAVEQALSSGFIAKMRANAGRTLDKIKEPIPDLLKNPISSLKESRVRVLGGRKNTEAASLLKTAESATNQNQTQNKSREEESESLSKRSLAMLGKIRDSIKEHIPQFPGLPAKTQLPPMLNGQKKDGKSGFGDRKLDQAVAQVMKNKSSGGILTEAVQLQSGEDAAQKIAKMVKPGEKSEDNPFSKAGANSATTAAQSSNPNSNLPPGIAQLLKDKFNGPTVVSTSSSASQPKEQPKPQMSNEVKSILASLPDFNSRPKDTPIPKVPGSSYGLLNNNALTHVSSSSFPLEADKAPLLQNMILQAGRTFAAFVPNFKLAFPRLPSGHKPEAGPEALVAKVPPLNPELETQMRDLGGAAAAPQPIPLDVSRILNRITPAAPSANPVIETHLSASVPIAAGPKDFDINKLIPSLKLPEQNDPAKLGALPEVKPSGLPERAELNLPQAARNASGQILAESQPTLMSPVLQEAIKKAEPIIKPALDAANSLAQTVAPMLVPKNNSQFTQPVQMSASAELPANNVPKPVAPVLDMQRYIAGVLPPAATGDSSAAGSASQEGAEPAGLSAEGLRQSIRGSGRQILGMQKSQSGAFTYMKPLFDSDREFVLGPARTRTISTTPSADSKSKQEEEDPITKRMRYLQNGGTLRKGEAFMFSEETGEAVLFLPDGSKEVRQLQSPEDSYKVQLKRRPDLVHPKDIQYSLNLLGKLLPAQKQQGQGGDPNSQQPVTGPTLDQLMNQMNQNTKGFWGWMKKSLNWQ